jgi:hypothetical protein
VKKTGRMIQLETKINNLSNQFEQREQISQTESDTIQDSIEKMKTKLSTIMNNQKFKLETEQCSPKTSIKQFSNSLRNIEF